VSTVYMWLVSDHLAVCPICRSAKYIVAKQLSGSGCHWWGQLRYMGVLDRGRDRRRGRGSFGG